MKTSVLSQALTKSYPLSKAKQIAGESTFYAVKDLDFSLDQGEVVAFLGPNGAGKSTTIKMLCGILTPTSGEAKIFGHQVGSKEANLKLGLVFGTRSQLYLHMTVAQSLDLIAEIYYVTGAEKKKRIEELAELFEIKQHLKSRVRTLSLGERMRCEIVASLIHKPRVLLADEPTIGLDIVAKNKLRELIRQWQEAEGTTLMLTSHDLSDVEALCERCILIDQGTKQFDGKLQALKGDFSDLRRIHITVPSHEQKRFLHDSFVALPPDTEGFVHGYEIRTKKIPINHAIQALSNHYQDHMQDLQISEVTLEEVLEKKYRRHAL